MTKKFVVYTVIVGGYDEVLQPLVVDDRFDYVLFTDNVYAERDGVWQLRAFDYYNEDKTRMSRYPKMHPMELLIEYEASLCIDACLQIAEKRIYDICENFYNQGIEWGGVEHFSLDCTYDEAYYVMAAGFERDHRILEYCHKLKKEGFPRHYGLYINNVIFRRHTEAVRDADALWWSLYDRFARRDQMFLPYVFWKIPELKRALLLPHGEHTFHNSTVVIARPHNGVSVCEGKRSLKQGFFEHARSRCRYGLGEKVERFSDFHYWLYGKPLWLSHILLDLWGFYALMIYGPAVKLRAVIKHRHQK